MSEMGSTSMFCDESTKMEPVDSPSVFTSMKTPVKRNIIIVRSPCADA